MIEADEEKENPVYTDVLSLNVPMKEQRKTQPEYFASRRSELNGLVENGTFVPIALEYVP